MRILFLTQYYPPETGAVQNRLSDLAKRLAKLGHQVEVLTALPSYPKGETYEGYRRRFVMTEQDQSIRIVRTWAYATKKKNFFSRILNYLSFAVLSVPVGWMAAGGADVVVVESPPLFLGFSGYLLSRFKRARFILNVSDLWPESAVALGMLRNRIMVRWATKAEEWLYHSANMVTGQTEGIVSSIQRRCPSTPVHLMTNGVAPEFLTQVARASNKREALREKFGFQGKFIVAYTGVHGLAQGLDTVVRSADLLKQYKQIRFHFFGDGPEKSHLELSAAKNGADNVEFHPPLSAAHMPELLASIDVSVVPLKRNDLFRGALPSKLFEALGAGVPVILALNGEAKNLIEQSHGGLAVEPENPSDMAEKILRLYQNADLRERIGASGRAFVVARYNREHIARRFEEAVLLQTPPTYAGLVAGVVQASCADNIEWNTKR